MIDGEIRQRSLDLVPYPPHGDAEDALAAGDQVDDLVGRGALVDRGAVAHEGDGGQILDTAGVQGTDRRTDLLERDPGVQKALDDLENQDVAEGVEPLGARSLGASNRWLNQPGTCPVVELAIRDAGGSAGHRPAVARVGIELGKRVTEQHALSTLRPCYRAGIIHAHDLLLSPEEHAPETGAAARLVRPRLHDRAT